MCTLVSSAYQRLGEVFGRVKTTPSLIRESDSRVAQAMQKVLVAKQAHVKAALDDKWQRYNPVFIGGDLFTFGYLAFQGIQSLKPSLQTIPAIGAATLACGCVAGVIWIGVGLVSLKEAMQAFRNNDKVLGLRLMLDSICCTAIGVVMVLASLAIKVSALAGIGAFFAANPWFLPVLFFVITIPLLLELSYRLNNIAASKDLASKLKLNELETLLQAKELDWKKIDQLYVGTESPFNLNPLETCGEKQQIQMLSQKMEEFQADMGVDAAVEVFELLKHIEKRNRKEALEHLAIAKKRIKEWNQSLYLRMFQQILYLVGFGISMGTLGAPAKTVNLLNGTQSFFLVGANIIPLYMDTFWPFKRNTPIVVPKVEESEIIKSKASG